MIRSCNLILEKTAMHQPISYDLWKYQKFQRKNYTKHLLWAIYSNHALLFSNFFDVRGGCSLLAAATDAGATEAVKKGDYYSTCILKSVKCAWFQLNAQAINMKVGEKKEIKNLLFLYGMPCWLLSCCSQISQTSNAATPRNIYILNLADNRYTVASVWDISELGFYGFDWNKITFCNWKGQNTMSLAVLVQFSSVHWGLFYKNPMQGIPH